MRRWDSSLTTEVTEVEPDLVILPCRVLDWENNREHLLLAQRKQLDVWTIAETYAV
jgi:hypothetical protein